ncbi:unnamed protein product [Pylaiella littoralis]
MARAGRSGGGGVGAVAVAALALASAVRSASATGANCTAMDLVSNNVTDYIRWSSMSDRLYLENGACVTMTDIYESRLDNSGNKGPVYPIDKDTLQKTDTVTGSWYLESSLYVQEGSRLVLKAGTRKGGDCDHLLLASSPTKYVELRAHGGGILMKNTHVESWDMDAGTVDEDDEDGRSWISAISEVITDPHETCSGTAKNQMGEARLDIIDSEVNHLGYYDSESYGISYKVRGFCNDSSNPEVFDSVGVYGDILRSEIHHNYFGHYSYGHQGGNFSSNEVHHNIGYGLDPHDDSDYMIIHDNHVHNNGWHGIIASKRCDHASIQNNHVHHNGLIDDGGRRTGNGIMLHRSSDYGSIKNNVVHDNMDSGIALYESSSCEISGNTIYSNKNGIRMSLGSSLNLVWDNAITIHGEDAKYAIYLYQGNDIPEVAGSTGRPHDNRFFSNTIISDSVAVKMVESDANAIEGNVIYAKASRFDDATSVLWKDNFMQDGGHCYKLEGSTSCFDPESDIGIPDEYLNAESSSSSSAAAAAANAEEESSLSYSFTAAAGNGFFCASAL